MISLELNVCLLKVIHYVKGNIDMEYFMFMSGFDEI